MSSGHAVAEGLAQRSQRAPPPRPSHEPRDGDRSCQPRRRGTARPRRQLPPAAAGHLRKRPPHERPRSRRHPARRRGRLSATSRRSARRRGDDVRGAQPVLRLPRRLPPAPRRHLRRRLHRSPRDCRRSDLAPQRAGDPLAVAQTRRKPPPPLSASAARDARGSAGGFPRDRVCRLPGRLLVRLHAPRSHRPRCRTSAPPPSG